MAVIALLGRFAGGADVRHPVDVEIQSRPPKHGLGRHHPQAATGHGCITVLLLASVQNGGITAQKTACNSPLFTQQQRVKATERVHGVHFVANLYAVDLYALVTTWSAQRSAKTSASRPARLPLCSSTSIL